MITMLNPKFYLSMICYVLGLITNKRLSAIKLFEKSLKYYSLPKHSYLCYKEIGIIYYYNDFFQKAKYYLHKAEALINEDERDTELLTFLGLVYYAEANYPAVKQYLEKALAKYGKFEWIKKDFIQTHLKASEFMQNSGDAGFGENSGDT